MSDSRAQGEVLTVKCPVQIRWGGEGNYVCSHREQDRGSNYSMWDLGQLWEGLLNNFMGLEESFSAVPERIRLSSLCSCRRMAPMAS